jgi:hypothetical protein
MYKRRSHARFVVAHGEGVLRVACDVTLTSTDGQLVVISVDPLAGSDRLMLEMVIDGQVAMVPVRVEETRPIIVDGEIRHQIRLSYLGPSAEVVVDDTGI